MPFLGKPVYHSAHREGLTKSEGEKLTYENRQLAQ